MKIKMLLFLFLQISTDLKEAGVFHFCITSFKEWHLLEPCLRQA